MYLKKIIDEITASKFRIWRWIATSSPGDR